MGKSVRTSPFCFFQDLPQSIPVYNIIYETGQKTKEIVLVIELTKHGTESIPEALRFFLVRLIFFDHLAGFFLISVQRCPHFV